MSKSVPHQKTITVNKEKCDKAHLYAAINLDAMEEAARKLDAGAFKLWCYFAKNQNGYAFALSSKDAEQTFGIKIKQYNNAVAELIEKGYLVQTNGNNYAFKEIAVITKSNNAVITKSNNAVITKSNNELLPKGIRNNTDNTLNTTIYITDENKSLGKYTTFEVIEKGWSIKRKSKDIYERVDTGELIQII